MESVAKIDFMVCWFGGTWDIVSHDIPLEVGRASNDEIVGYVKKHHPYNDAIYIGVYWRDPIVDEPSPHNPMN